MEGCAGIFVQRAGLTLTQAEGTVRTFALTGVIPEPPRAAHLIAGGITRGGHAGAQCRAASLKTVSDMMSAYEPGHQQ